MNPTSIDAEWWGEYTRVTNYDYGYPKEMWLRHRVLRYVGINNGMFMFTVYPSRLWVLYPETEVKARYEARTLREFVIKGGKA